MATAGVTEIDAFKEKLLSEIATKKLEYFKTTKDVTPTRVVIPPHADDISQIPPSRENVNNSTVTKETGMENQQDQRQQNEGPNSTSKGQEKKQGMFSQFKSYLMGKSDKETDQKETNETASTRVPSTTQTTNKKPPPNPGVIDLSSF